MNEKEKAIPFLGDFVKNLGNFLFGNPTDKEGNIKPLDPRYKGPGFQGLPEHQKEKEYELLRKQGPQAFAPINNDFGMMQEIPQFFNPLTGRKEAVDGGGMLFAGAPRFIKYGGPANSIVRPINIDSRHMDHLLNERRKMMGVQLPPFV
tara:strand:+ start:1394 stop:1840 length:447 start_codon:yes stop_codon:yes gene_type:complete